MYSCASRVKGNVMSWCNLSISVWNFCLNSYSFDLKKDTNFRRTALIEHLLWIILEFPTEQPSKQLSFQTLALQLKHP